MSGRLAAGVAMVGVTVLALVAAAQARTGVDTRVTVFGDSVATAIAYDPDAKRVLARGIDLRLEVAACRRVGDTSCPYDGVRPPNVIDRAAQLGKDLGPVVVVIVGYNDYEDNYADNIEQALATFRTAGVEHVLWATLRESRQSYANMNDMIRAAARKHPELTVVDWNAVARGNPDWLQPDGIHLTAQGAQGMAALLDDALVDLGVVPRPAPPTVARALAIVSHALPPGRRGRAYTASLRAVGGTAPYRWRTAGGSLAPGLRLLASGRVTGTPLRRGRFVVRARVLDRAGVARTRIVSLRIA